MAVLFAMFWFSLLISSADDILQISASVVILLHN